MELKIVIRCTNKKRILQHFFHNVEKNCVGREYHDIKCSYKMQMTDEVQMKLIEYMNSLIIK